MTQGLRPPPRSAARAFGSVHYPATGRHLPVSLKVVRPGFLLGEWVWVQNLVTMLFGPIINMYSAEEWGLAMKNSLQELPLAKPSLPPSSNKKTKGGEMNLKHENHAFGTISEISSQSGFQKLSCPSLGVPDPSARGPQRARAEDCRASTPADALEPAKSRRGGPCSDHS